MSWPTDFTWKVRPPVKQGFFFSWPRPVLLPSPSHGPSELSQFRYPRAQASLRDRASSNLSLPVKWLFLLDPIKYFVLTCQVRIISSDIT